ncbi:unnamed protein product [Prorocentrum cordatum]|uniref:Uncharacterized protein n=1 Tax=Prorocentrum cordatum TaxID=2364126 RepID=A0ABN9UPB4_9DINO|nr:unnamed protein product [Polarella glacialis]
MSSARTRAVRRPPDGVRDRAASRRDHARGLADPQGLRELLAGSGLRLVPFGKDGLDATVESVAGGALVSAPGVGVRSCDWWPDDLFEGAGLVPMWHWSSAGEAEGPVLLRLACSGLALGASGRCFLLRHRGVDLSRDACEPYTAAMEDPGRGYASEASSSEDSETGDNRPALRRSSSTPRNALRAVTPLKGWRLSRSKSHNGKWPKFDAKPGGPCRCGQLQLQLQEFLEARLGRLEEAARELEEQLASILEALEPGSRARRPPEQLLGVQRSREGLLGAGHLGGAGRRGGPDARDPCVTEEARASRLDISTLEPGSSTL